MSRKEIIILQTFKAGGQGEGKMAIIRIPEDEDCPYSSGYLVVDDLELSKIIDRAMNNAAWEVIKKNGGIKNGNITTRKTRNGFDKPGTAGKEKGNDKRRIQKRRREKVSPVVQTKKKGVKR
jgi:hypothetical protein